MKNFFYKQYAPAGRVCLPLGVYRAQQNTNEPLRIGNTLGAVKRHNVCKRHGLLDTGCKQTDRRHFFPHYPNGIKLNCSRKFAETVPKLSLNSGNRNSQDFHNNQYSDPV